MPGDSSSTEKLRFVKAIDPNVFKWIPRQLYEQIDGIEDYQIDNLIACGMHTMNRFIAKNGELILVPNPMVHIAVLADDQNMIRGFIWADIDVIEELIFVQAASVEKKYQGDFKRRIVDYLFGLDIDPRCKHRIRMATMNPEAAERCGWKRSKMVLMEIENDVVGTNQSESK